MFTFNKNYAIATLFLFITEVLIALYLHDKIIRPFGGDFLVVILLFTLVKTFFNVAIKPAAWTVLGFSYTVEALQYFKIVKLLGLQNNKLANIIVGNYYSWWDILAYTLGIATVLIIAHLRKKFS
ncbi:MAG: DUF2809 domain-containing protein [Sphingobacteriales bacterium]|nr:MAG: DUF2809 domain-containing protein [Sphingobacteriales bacterium]